tara:strand:- start:1177 stop:1953 length:777 start_codon:yes stop_codon:yes gene_type:complete
MRDIEISSHARSGASGYSLLSKNGMCETIATNGFQVGNINSSTVKRTFSQSNRHTTMTRHSRDAALFIEQQQKVLCQLIKEFQIFVGYREQLPVRQRRAISSDTWSVYLMHAQSLQNAMKQTFMGKSLFGDGVQQPIRFHIEQEAGVSHFDLPDPKLVTMVSLQSFLAGVNDHNLPSVELGNACMSDLLNALVEVQDGRAHLNQISKNLSKRRKLQERKLSSRSITSTISYNKPTLAEKLSASISSVLRFAFPVKLLD